MDYEDYGYDNLLRKKKDEQHYMSASDAEVFIESIGENKVKVRDTQRTKTIKQYVDDEISRVKKLIV